MKKLAAATLLAASLPAMAIGFGTPTTYSKLLWFSNFPVSGLFGCGQMIADATGDLINSNGLVIYGAINCANGGGYSITGSAYFATDGSINMTLNAAAGYTIVCPRLFNFSGTCNIYDSAGNSRGIGSVTFP